MELDRKITNTYVRSAKRMNPRKKLNDPTLKRLSMLVFQARSQKKWSQTIVSDFMDVSKSTISDWEQGIYDIPLTKAIELCTLLNVDIKEIFKND